VRFAGPIGGLRFGWVAHGSATQASGPRDRRSSPHVSAVAGLADGSSISARVELEADGHRLAGGAGGDAAALP